MMWHARCPVWIKEVCRTQHWMLYRVLSFRIACLRILSPRTARSVLNCCTALRVRTLVCMCDGVIQNCLCVEIVVQHCMICGTPSRSIACWESGNSFGGLPCPVVVFGTLVQQCLMWVTIIQQCLVNDDHLCGALSYISAWPVLRTFVSVSYSAVWSVTRNCVGRCHVALPGLLQEEFQWSRIYWHEEVVVPEYQRFSQCTLFFSYFIITASLPISTQPICKPGVATWILKIIVHVWEHFCTSCDAVFMKLPLA